MKNLGVGILKKKVWLLLPFGKISERFRKMNFTNFAMNSNKIGYKNANEKHFFFLFVSRKFYEKNIF